MWEFEEHERSVAVALLRYFFYNWQLGIREKDSKGNRRAFFVLFIVVSVRLLLE